MQSLEGIIAANRNSERQQEYARAINKAPAQPTKPARRALPKQDKSGRLAR